MSSCKGYYNSLFLFVKGENREERLLFKTTKNKCTVAGHVHLINKLCVLSKKNRFYYKIKESIQV